MKLFLFSAVLLLQSTLISAQIPKLFSPRKQFPFGQNNRIDGVPKNVIYLTIDDGPTRYATPKMLDVLQEI